VKIGIKQQKKPTFLIGSFALSLAVPTGFKPAIFRICLSGLQYQAETSIARQLRPGFPDRNTFAALDRVKQKTAFLK